MERERLDNWCEKGILWIVLAIVVFGPVAAGAVSSVEFFIIEALTVCALTLWIARLWIKEDYRLLWPPICWAVLAFAGYAIIRYQQADIEYVARAEFIRVITYASIFLIILNNLHRQESVQTICVALIFLGMVLSLYAVYQMFTNTAYVWHLLHPELKPDQYLKRGSGTYICPNHFAGYIEMVVPLALAFMFKGRFHHTTKVFLGYAALAMLAGIAVSVSRGGWLAACAALLVLFCILLRYRDTRLPALVFLTLLLIVAAFVFKRGYQPQERWNQFFRESGAVYDIRFYLWEPAVRIWRENFWWGAGPGHFNDRFPRYRPEIVQLSAGRVHNDYLNTLADWGLVGALLVVSAWALLYWGAFKTWRFVRRTNDISSKPSNRGAFILGGAIGLLAILFHSFVDFNMHVPANAILTVALMAMVSGYLRFATERYWVTSRWLVPLAITAIGIAGAFFLGQHGVKAFKEAMIVGEADRLRRSIEKDTLEWRDLSSPDVTRPDHTRIENLYLKVREETEQEVDILKTAYALEPSNSKTTYRIGQSLRSLSELTRGEQSDVLLREAMKWFEAGIQLNPYDPYNYLRTGMCLVSFREYSDAAPFFEKSMELDPNNYFVVAHYGWYFFQIGDLRTAKHWFQKSLSLRLPDWSYNQIATKYLEIIDRLMKAEATNPR